MSPSIVATLRSESFSTGYASMEAAQVPGEIIGRIRKFADVGLWLSVLGDVHRRVPESHLMTIPCEETEGGSIPRPPTLDTLDPPVSLDPPSPTSRPPTPDPRPSLSYLITFFATKPRVPDAKTPPKHEMRPPSTMRPSSVHPGSRVLCGCAHSASFRWGRGRGGMGEDTVGGGRGRFRTLRRQQDAKR